MRVATGSISEQSYELQFWQERIVGMKRATDSLGYELVPQTPARMLPQTLGSPCVRRVASMVFEASQPSVRDGQAALGKGALGGYEPSLGAGPTRYP